jgi:hypothetical protein
MHKATIVHVKREQSAKSHFGVPKFSNELLLLRTSILKINSKEQIKIKLIVTRSFTQKIQLLVQHL